MRIRKTPPTITDIPPCAERAILSDILGHAFGSFVYFLVYGDEVIYVGETTNLRARMAAHAKTKDFRRR